MGGVFRSVFGGRGSAPQAPFLPAQQAAPELMDVVDEIAGVQTITVTGPDGKKRRVTQKLPLTPQEQQTLDQARALMNQAVNNIQRLYQYDPATVANYQPFIQAFANINQERMADLGKIGDFKDISEKVEQFKTMNHALTMEAFDNKQRMTEENLAKRGLQRSTEATENRAAMAKQRAQLEQEVNVTSENYGEDLQNRRLDREARTYAIREQGRNARLEEANAGYELERQKAADLDAVRQNAINENVNMLNVGQGITGQDTQRAQLGLAGNQNAVAIFGAQANNQNQRYANDINRVQAQHNMDMNTYRNTPATFGQQIRDIGIAGAGQFVGNRIARIGNTTTPEPVTAPQNPGRAAAFGQLRRVGRA